MAGEHPQRTRTAPRKGRSHHGSSSSHDRNLDLMAPPRHQRARARISVASVGSLLGGEAHELRLLVERVELHLGVGVITR